MNLKASAMRKKESWMQIGNTVLALGQKGVITAMQENTINHIDFVYAIYVEIEGDDRRKGIVKLLASSPKFHPDDVQEYVIPV
jgi:hypothetical protein